MIITWYGQACFRIQTGNTTIAIDPFAKEIGLTPPRFHADIILVSHDHMDHANTGTFPDGAFLVSEPGEYEIGGISIRGVGTFHDTVKGKERGMNTAYVIEAEDLRILHLGDFGEDSVRVEVLEEFGSVDILMIPVGGIYTIDGKQAAKIVHQIEAKKVIPMHYAIPGLKVKLDEVDGFFKEMGVSKSVGEEKLVIKKKDIPSEEGTFEVIILKPISGK